MCIIISIEDMRNEQPVRVALSKVQDEGWVDTDTTETPDEHTAESIGAVVDADLFRKAMDYLFEAALSSRNHNKFKVHEKIAFVKACCGLNK